MHACVERESIGDTANFGLCSSALRIKNLRAQKRVSRPGHRKECALFDVRELVGGQARVQILLDFLLEAHHRFGDHLDELERGCQKTRMPAEHLRP